MKIGGTEDEGNEAYGRNLEDVHNEQQIEETAKTMDRLAELTRQ